MFHLTGTRGKIFAILRTVAEAAATDVDDIETLIIAASVGSMITEITPGSPAMTVTSDSSQGAPSAVFTVAVAVAILVVDSDSDMSLTDL
jgi:hypothetical protein